MAAAGAAGGCGMTDEATANGGPIGVPSDAKGTRATKKPADSRVCARKRYSSVAFLAGAPQT
jgi:hypothetical protein